MPFFKWGIKALPQPLDLGAITMVLILGIPLGLLLYTGDATHPRVQTFSWQNKSVGAEDTAFILTFNRPMNWDSVATHIRILPPLLGKFSTSGRRFVYTLQHPIPYGQTFRLTLQGATDTGQSASTQRVMQPFTRLFRSRDRAFAYIGVGGVEDGRLVLRNLTRQQTTILTPPNWVVMGFKPYPEGDRILVGAVERKAEPLGAFEQQLYSVSTGLASLPPGQAQLLLNNHDAQILKFDLSANGSSIVVQRYNRNKREPVGLWALSAKGELRSLSYTAAGEFLVTPDGSAVAIAQNQGISVFPITADPNLTATEYLPQLGMTLGFSRDASAATMMKFNPNNTRSLFLVTNQGIQKELLTTNGYILKTQFDPMNQRVFCLYTRLGSNTADASTLYLSAINLSTLHRHDLIQRPGKTIGHMSLAPDGSALLWDDMEVTEQSTTSILKDEVGEAIAKSTLRLFPLGQDPNSSQPSVLSISGVQPVWMP